MSQKQTLIMLKLVARKLNTNHKKECFSKGQTHRQSVKITDEYWKYLLSKVNVNSSQLTLISHSEFQHQEQHLSVNQLVVNLGQPVIFMDYNTMTMVTVLLRETQI